MPGTAGTQQATIAETFRKRLQQLRASAGKQADALIGSGARPWQVPDDTGDLLDIEKLHKPGFDRQLLNDAYQKCMQDTAAFGTTGDVIALKQQIDYVATEERAFRLRHATVCRAMVHGGLRRQGQSISRIFSNIEKQVSDIIANGGA